MVPPKYLKEPATKLQDALRNSGVIKSNTFTKTAAVFASGASLMFGASTAEAQMLSEFPGNPWPMFKSSQESRVSSNAALNESPQIAFDSDGNFVVVYQSYVNSSFHYQVLFQRYDSNGNKVGSETVAYDGTSVTWTESNPKVAMDSDGEFMIVWEQGSQGIKGKIFTETGADKTGVLNVNESGGSHLHPVIDVDSNGDFLVAWRGYNAGAGTYRINGKRFNNDGSVDTGETDLSGTIPVNQAPGLSIDSDGDFVIAYSFYDSATTSDDIAIRGFSNNFTQNLATSKVNTNTTTGNQRLPNVAHDEDGNFIVVWQDNHGHDGSYNGVFAQLYNASGAKNGTEFSACSFTYEDQNNPDVAMDHDGNFIITWEYKYDQPSSYNYSVMAQKFKADATPIGDEFRVNVHAEGYQQQSDVRFDNHGNFRVVYSSEDFAGNGNYDAVIRSFECNPNPAQQGRQAKVSTDGEAPDIAFDDDGSHGVVAWDSYDYYGKYYYIEVQRLGSDGQPTGSVIDIIPNSQTDERHKNPVVAMDSDGDFVVVWQGYNIDSDDYGIIAQMVDKDGTLSNGQIIVNTAQAGAQIQPRVAMAPGGEFVVMWEDTNTNEFKAQRFSSAGVHEGSEITIGNSGGNNWTGIDIMDDASFAVTWPEYSAGQTDIMVQRYTANGNKDGNAFSPHAATAGEDEKTPDISLDKDGNLVIVWMDYTDNSSYYDVRAHLYDKDNNPKGSAFTVNQRTEGDQGWPAVSFDNNGNFTVGFDTYYQYEATGESYFGSDVHAIAFDKDGNALTHEFGVASETYKYQENVRIAHAGNGQMMLVWQSYYYDHGPYTDHSINVAKFAMPVIPGSAPSWLTLNGSTTTTMDSLVSPDPNGDTIYEVSALPVNASLTINGVNANVGDHFDGSDTLVFTSGGGGVGNFSVNTTDRYTGQTGSTTIAIYGEAPATDITAGSDSNDYGLFSIPSNTQTTWDVLLSNFGAYNPINWRAYGYNNGYEEGSAITGIDSAAYLGRGVWIIARSSQDIVMSDTPAITSDVTISINAGWNLIGNPFLAQVSKDQICVDTGSGFVPLIDQSTVQTTLYTWNRSSANYVTVNGLGTFEGAWIYSSSAGSLKFVAPGNL